MRFQVEGVVTELVKQGSGQKGPWYLYAIKETRGDKSKTWRFFSNQQLSTGVRHNVTGYISESPNKAYTDSAGRNPYTQSFSAENIEVKQDEMDF